jgi:hypothetical protein
MATASPLTVASPSTDKLLCCYVAWCMVAIELHTQLEHLMDRVAINKKLPAHLAPMSLTVESLHADDCCRTGVCVPESIPVCFRHVLAPKCNVRACKCHVLACKCEPFSHTLDAGEVADSVLQQHGMRALSERARYLPRRHRTARCSTPTPSDGQMQQTDSVALAPPAAGYFHTPSSGDNGVDDVAAGFHAPVCTCRRGRHQPSLGKGLVVR